MQEVSRGGRSAFEGLKKQEAILTGQVEQIEKQIELIKVKNAKQNEIVITAQDEWEAMKMSTEELKAYTDHMFKTQGAHQKLLNQMRQEKKVRYSQAEHALESVRVESAEKYRGIVQNTLNDLGYLMDKEAEQRRL